MSDVQYYLVSTVVLATMQRGPYVHFNATSVPPEHTLHLVWINWGPQDVAARESFEADPNVTALGDPWKPLPATAVLPLQALAAVEDQRRAKAGMPALMSSITSLADTVATALRKAAPRHRPD